MDESDKVKTASVAHNRLFRYTGTQLGFKKDLADFWRGVGVILAAAR